MWHTPDINLVLLKRAPLDVPYVLDDCVLSVRNMLSRAGFSTYLSFNTIDPNLINILFGIQMPGTASIEQIRAVTTPGNTIIFNTEQLGSTSGWITPEYLALLGEYVCFDYNGANIEHLLLHTSNHATAFEFPLLPSLDFCNGYPVNPKERSIQYDLAFYGSSGLGDRVERLEDLSQRGLRLKCFAGSYGSNLPKELLPCSAVLNLHGYETAIFEALRCLRPVAMGIPIFSDISMIPRTVNWADSGIFFLNKEGFAKQVDQLVRDSDEMLGASQRMTAFVNDPKWPQLAKDVMEQALMAVSLRA